MKSITLKDNDKLFRFAKKWGRMPHYPDGLDTCKLKRRIALGVLTFTLCKLCILTCAVFVGASLGDFLAWAYICVTQRYVVPDTLCLVFICTCLTALAAVGLMYSMAGVYYCGEQYHQYLRRKRKEQKLVEPGTLKHLYLSFKDKYCAKIVVTRSDS